MGFRTKRDEGSLRRTLPGVWQAAPAALALLDAEGRIVAINAAFQTLFHQSEEQVHGRSLFSLLQREDGTAELDQARFREQYQRRRFEQRTPVEIEIAGAPQWLELDWGFIDNPPEPPRVVAVVRNNTERMQVERELRSANAFLSNATRWAKELAAGAELASAAQEPVLASVSHEIRTPMNGILGMTDLALLTELTSDQREYLQGHSRLRRIAARSAQRHSISPRPKPTAWNSAQRHSGCANISTNSYGP